MNVAFDSAKLATLYAGSEELNRLKKEIDCAANIVSLFLATLLPLNAEKFQVGVDCDGESYWEFSFCMGRPRNSLQLTTPDGGLRTAYSNAGTSTVFAKVKVVHGIVPQLLTRVMEKYPSRFNLFLQPFLEAGIVAQARQA